jgi:uncharacterized RDD family membrane protein YckC
MNSGPAEEVVLGLDNVAIEVPVAGLGTRALAAALDYLLFGVLVFVMLLGGLWVVGTARLPFGWSVAVLLLCFFLVEYGYFAGLEIAFEGRTPGKRVVGLRVVARSGGRADATALLLRNLVRSVDLFAGLPLMALDPLARRLGDRLAGTLVVHAQARLHEVVLHRLPRGFGAAEAAVLEGLLRRAADLEPARAEAMARRLIQRIERDDPDYLAGSDASLAPIERLRRAGLGA